MLNVVNLVPPNRKEMLELLEVTQRSVDQGEIRSLVVVAIGTDKSTFSGFAGAEDVAALLGEAELLKARLIDQARANGMV